ncbi:MerR family DNA-binding transcriptional regulator [Paenibacillus sp. J5C_2022]|uniref:MerR family transcriptional regulator n=1 Tax=Paenibacillus sp. J5C2022 TaxID=2977129 RepID=UPI0021D18372|nr:MerR family transcriptional regulator [Paenibacillus sp. J5C2022]MCU6713107.1 MerR family DNA-binding transcriptional regulator [Paenibacillus sp. J5C2022]
MRPVDIARQLKVSTSSLRHYESMGIVPEVERTESGYRVYTEEHYAYFSCIVAMKDGFGMQRTGEVLVLVLDGRQEEALWLISDSKAQLFRDKTIAEKTIKALESEPETLLPLHKRKKGWTIGEMAEYTLIPASAIRHWEKMGLLTVERDPDNGYRVFSPSNLRQILTIRTLKSAIWSLDVIKRIIADIDNDRLDYAITAARAALDYLNVQNKNQLRGSYYLYRLMQEGE